MIERVQLIDEKKQINETHEIEGRYRSIFGGRKV